MAYVLGYFAADGSMIANRRGGYYIEFTSTDRILLEHVLTVVGGSQKISTRPCRSAKWKTQYRIQIGCRQWFDDLLALGFTPNKSLTLRFPNMPDSVFGGFVRGYFDGDGCVYFNELKYSDRTYKRWVLMTLFTSGSEAFLEDLHTRLRKCGVRKGTIVSKRGGALELKFSHHDSLALYQIMYNTAQVGVLFLPRKREKLEKAISQLHLTNAVVA